MVGWVAWGCFFIKAFVCLLMLIFIRVFAVALRIVLLGTFSSCFFSLGQILTFILTKQERLYFYY